MLKPTLAYIRMLNWLLRSQQACFASCLSASMLPCNIEMVWLRHTLGIYARISRAFVVAGLEPAMKQPISRIYLMTNNSIPVSPHARKNVELICVTDRFQILKIETGQENTQFHIHISLHWLFDFIPQHISSTVTYKK
jgi:hypothetical protein